MIDLISSISRRFEDLISYHPRISALPLIVIGRIGAFGKIKRMPNLVDKHSSGTMDSKSCPSAPSPCSQIMLALCVS